MIRVIILYDTSSVSDSTGAFIDSVGKRLAASGVYVEKAKCNAFADYSFIRDFDVVVLGAPVYYLIVSSQLLGSLIHGNLKKYLKGKKIALFLSCGTPEYLASVLYLPQLKMHFLLNKILVEKVFSSNEISSGKTADSFAADILHQYQKTIRSRSRVKTTVWADDAVVFIENVPAFLQAKLKAIAEKYAQDNGYNEITVEMLLTAREEMGG
jgi:multimeric flavodoxin WrbA